MDAIMGMGEDPYSCGEFSEPLTEDQAKKLAAEIGADLFASHPDDPYDPQTK